jgi:hypothetical protein
MTQRGFLTGVIENIVKFAPACRRGLADRICPLGMQAVFPGVVLPMWGLVAPEARLGVKNLVAIWKSKAVIASLKWGSDCKCRFFFLELLG